MRDIRPTVTVRSNETVRDVGNKLFGNGFDRDSDYIARFERYPEETSTRTTIGFKETFSTFDMNTSVMWLFHYYNEEQPDELFEALLGGAEPYLFFGTLLPARTQRRQ